MSLRTIGGISGDFSLIYKAMLLSTRSLEHLPCPLREAGSAWHHQNPRALPLKGRPKVGPVAKAKSGCPTYSLSY